MATKLFLRSTTTNPINDGNPITYDMLTTAGSAAVSRSVDSTASGTNIQWTFNTVDDVLIEWISGRVPSGGFTLAGLMTFSIWARESVMTVNAGARARVYKRTAAGVETEVAGGPWDDGVEFGTSDNEMVWSATPTSTAFAENDRIILRLYITNAPTLTMGSGNCVLTFDAANAATGDSFFQIFEDVTFKAESVNKTLAADAGSFALTGTAASLEVGKKVVAAAGSYALTGTNATLRRNLPLAAGAGSYAVTGQAASLLHKRIVTAGAGEYALTGTNATLSKGLTLALAGGSYAFTGTDASPKWGHKLSAAAGSYALTGTNATLRRNLPLVAGGGSFSLTGTSAALLLAREIVAATGSYSLTGTAAALELGLKLTVAAGSYTLTGTDASLVAGSNKALSAEGGSYALSGQAASLLHQWLITAGAGSFELSGTNATLTLSGAVAADLFRVCGRSVNYTYTISNVSGEFMTKKTDES